MQKCANRHRESPGQITVSDNLLTDSQKAEFVKLMKAGVYKELHRRKLLTDFQLNNLLGRI